MCQALVSRKRPRSDSTASSSVRRPIPQVTPVSCSSRNSNISSNSSDESSYSEYDDDDEYDASEPEAETSFESPASLSSVSSSASPSSLGAVMTPRPDHKRRRMSMTEASTQEQSNGRAQHSTDATDTIATTRPLSAERDEIVAAILTIASALGLTKETLHVCVDLLDRYLALSKEKDASRLETLSIACLWLAVKFVETPETIIKRSIKQILKRRRHSGNWTWHEIIRQEGAILKVLNFRMIAPTVLSVLQAKLHAEGAALTLEQRQLAFYFADLLLLKDRANEYSKELLVDAIWFIVTGHQIAEVQAPLLAPVVILFLAHRDNINPQHTAYKTWFALRCQYGPSLQAPWQLPYDPKCECRVCEHSEELVAAPPPPPTPATSTSPSTSSSPSATSSTAATAEAPTLKSTSATRSCCTTS